MGRSNNELLTLKKYIFAEYADCRSVCDQRFYLNDKVDVSKYKPLRDKLVNCDYSISLNLIKL